MKGKDKGWRDESGALCMESNGQMIEEKRGK